MRRHSSAYLGWRVFVLGLLLVFCGLFASAYCQAADVAVLIEQSPPSGGEVAGGTGIRYFPFGSKITLTAVPKRGYHFLYWLGDVVDPHSISTVAFLDGPKIIVAVYAKVPEEGRLELEAISPPSSAGSGGGGGVRAAEPTSSLSPPPPSPPHPPPPPIAEPSTIFLFGLAAVMLRKMRRPI